MLSFIGRRVLLGLFTIWAVSVLSFVIIQLPPGDIVTAHLAQLSDAGGGGSAASEAGLLRAQYGLDQPLYLQYLKWVGQLLRGNMGMSFDYDRPVADVLGDNMLLSIVVAVASILLTWVLALPIGIYSAVRKYSVGDYTLTFVGFIGLAIPNFLLALILMYLGFTLFGANVGGLYSPQFETAPWSLAKAWDLAGHLVIPAIVLGLAGTAQLVRVMRANLLDELKKPYVTTARAKGLTERRLILKYPVRVALNPFASTIGFIFPQIVSGTIVVSIALGLPTVGPLLVRALGAQDMYLAGAIVLLLGVLTVIGTLISDLILMWLDPRIRHAR
jgi:peptide/nickel transport system permease protein